MRNAFGRLHHCLCYNHRYFQRSHASVREAIVTTTSAASAPLWRNREYVLLWCGQTVNVIGTQVSQIAYPLLVLALTGSPAKAGFVAAARTVPYRVIALPAGALVDRWDRKRVMILCSAGSGL